MSITSFVTAAERFIASLFSGASEVEGAIATVQADPILSTAVTGAKAVVKAELIKAGVPAENIETTGAAILHGLSTVSASVPTLLADARALEGDVMHAASTPAPSAG